MVTVRNHSSQIRPEVHVSSTYTAKLCHVIIQSPMPLTIISHLSNIYCGFINGRFISHQVLSTRSHLCWPTRTMEVWIKGCDPQDIHLSNHSPRKNKQIEFWISHIMEGNWIDIKTERLAYKHSNSVQTLRSRRNIEPDSWRASIQQGRKTQKSIPRLAVGINLVVKIKNNR